MAVEARALAACGRASERRLDEIEPVPHTQARGVDDFNLPTTIGMSRTDEQATA
jgi:hypothetical protein